MVGFSVMSFQYRWLKFIFHEIINQYLQARIILRCFFEWICAIIPKAKNVSEFEESENSDDETGSYIANEDENCSDESIEGEEQSIEDDECMDECK